MALPLEVALNIRADLLLYFQNDIICMMQNLVLHL